jgi:hypothetical protein
MVLSIQADRRYQIGEDESMTIRAPVLIDVENLMIDVQNPRYDPAASQREALAKIALRQKDKLIKLARDMVENGPDPSEVLLVAATDDPKQFIVLEGNRRAAALKLLSSDSLLKSLRLPADTIEKLMLLRAEAGGQIPGEVYCVVLEREDANHWIRLKHTGENEGAGVVRWDGPAAHRFRGNSPALQAIDLVAKSKYIDEETKRKLPEMYITNVERLLGTREARECLGVSVKNRHLTLEGDEEEALQRLAMVVSDVANGLIKVTQVDSQGQRIAYARSVAERPLFKKSPGTKGALAAAASPKHVRRIAADRTTLVPRRLKLTIPHTRMNKIYYELQGLKVVDFENCCSVMLRVFLELSVDQFAEDNGIALTVPIKSGPGAGGKKEMSFRKKIGTVVEYMEQKNICTKDKLKGIKVLMGKEDHVFSIDTLHAYVHNKDFSPSADDLKATWDKVQPFMEVLWRP